MERNNFVGAEPICIVGFNCINQPLGFGAFCSLILKEKVLNSASRPKCNRRNLICKRILYYGKFDINLPGNDISMFYVLYLKLIV